MKIFSPQELKSASEKETEILRLEKTKLTKDIQGLQAKKKLLQGEVTGDLQKLADQVGQQKQKLLKELSAIEVSLKKKKDLYYSLIEKQDALDERETELGEWEEILRRREKFLTERERQMA